MLRQPGITKQCRTFRDGNLVPKYPSNTVLPGFEMKMKNYFERGKRARGLFCVFCFAPMQFSCPFSLLSFLAHGQRSNMTKVTVAYSDSVPTLYVVHGRAKPVLHGPDSTETNLFHHGETTYRVG